MDYSKRLHNIIPGGAHTYSRGDDQFPSNAPPILERGEGCRVWDPEGREFVDYGMGLRSVNIGYGDREIADAVMQEVLKGNNLTRASVTELQAAELLRTIIPSAEMVKFAKHGSTVTTAAVKLSRAFTGRKFVAIPFEHPFFSFDDWFIGSTQITKGIPEQGSPFTLKFHYNDLDSLKNLFIQYPGQIAAVMLEPATTIGPCPRDCADRIFDCCDCTQHPQNFLHQVKSLCNKEGSVFILDEMITGFRWDFHGAQHFYGIEPDLSTFGKAMANGFAVAALTGKKEIMNLGGILEEGRERVFLVSTTHGAEMGALGAFIKTMEVLKRDKVVDHFWTYGKSLMQGINDIAKSLGIQENFYLEGYPCSPNYITRDKEKKVSLAFRALFSQEMINQGILMPYIALSKAHGQKELEQTLEAVSSALKIYTIALDQGIDGYLKSKPLKPVFRQFN